MEFPDGHRGFFIFFSKFCDDFISESRLCEAGAAPRDAAAASARRRPAGSAQRLRAAGRSSAPEEDNRR